MSMQRQSPEEGQIEKILNGLADGSNVKTQELKNQLNALIHQNHIEVFEIGYIIRNAVDANIEIKDAVEFFINKLIVENTKFKFSANLMKPVFQPISQSANVFMMQYNYERSRRLDELILMME